MAKSISATFIVIPQDWKTRFETATGKEAVGHWTVIYSYFAKKGIPIPAQELYEIASDWKQNAKGFGTRGGTIDSAISFGRQNVRWFINNGVFVELSV